MTGNGPVIAFALGVIVGGIIGAVSAMRFRVLALIPLTLILTATIGVVHILIRGSAVEAAVAAVGAIVAIQLSYLAAGLVLRRAGLAPQGRTPAENGPRGERNPDPTAQTRR